MKMEMKNNSTEKISVGRLTNSVDHIEDKISGLEDKYNIESFDEIKLGNIQIFKSWA